MHKHPFYAHILDSRILKELGKTPKMNEYNEKGDIDKHMQLINECLNYFHVEEASKCKLCALNLMISSRLWFNTLSNRTLSHG